MAEVTEDPRLVMELNGSTIVNLSRAFLDTNGAKRYADAEIDMPERASDDGRDHPFAEHMKKLVSDLNVCSEKGLAERFDSTIGAGTVLMPYGGRRQLTPEQAMACKLPVLNGTTNTASLMGWGFDPSLLADVPGILRSYQFRSEALGQTDVGTAWCAEGTDGAWHCGNRRQGFDVRNLRAY